MEDFFFVRSVLLGKQALSLKLDNFKVTCMHPLTTDQSKTFKSHTSISEIFQTV